MQNLTHRKYQFTITPTSLTTIPPTSSSSLSHPKKTIVIKLGDTMGRCNQLNKSMVLTTEVLYSESNGKYCPIKAIIKIYDKVDDENQIISGIGSFQVQEVLDRGCGKQVLEKIIGSTTIKMELIVRKLQDINRDSLSHSNSNSYLNNNSQSIISSQSLRASYENGVNGSGSGLEEFNKLGGIRRVNVGNFGPVYNMSEIVDLKNGVNLGYTKHAPSKQSIQTISKSPQKITTVQKNTHQIQPSRNTTSQKPIPKLENRPSIDSQPAHQHQTLNYPQVQKIQSQVMLQLESNPSNDLSLSHNSHLNGHINFNFPTLTEHNGQAKNIISTNIEEVKSMSIVSDGDNPAIDNQNKLGASLHMKVGQLKKNNFSKYQRFQQGESLPSPGFKIYGSLENSGASVTNSLASLQQHQRNEIQTLGQLLIQQRRKNLQYEDKIQKLQLKLIASKQKCLQINQRWSYWRDAAYHFVQHLHQDMNGNYIIQEIKGKDLIAIKYQITQESLEIFRNFLSLTVENCKFYEDSSRNPQHSQMASQLTVPKRKHYETENSQISTPELEKVLQKIESTFTSNTKLLQTNKKYESRVTQLQQLVKKSQIQVQELTKQKTKSLQTCKYLQRQVGYLEAQVKSLIGINTFLKQKQTRMQNIVNLKQQTIVHLKKKMQQNNTELDKLEQDIELCKKSAENKDLMLEEMRQELADKEETIQAYRQNYGQMSKIKKRADKIDRDIVTYIQSMLHADS